MNGLRGGANLESQNCSLVAPKLNRLPMSEGVSHLFSFPFWLYVDSSAPLATGTGATHEMTFRFYPPFRSAASNFSPMPPIRPSSVPFEPNARPERPLRLFSVAVRPLLKADGGPGIVSAWSAGTPTATEVMQAMDSVRIDVYGKATDELELNAILRRLLEWIRVITKQWWILRSADALLRYERHAFKIDEKGVPIADNPANLSHARIPFGFETGINDHVWRYCVEAAMGRVHPALHELTLLDGFYYVAAGDFRNAVLNAAAAFEQAIETRCTELWLAKYGKRFRRGHLAGDNATLHVSRELDRRFGRSFSREFPRTFHQLRMLWSARGEVAHGKSARFRDHGNWMGVTDTVAEQMVRAVAVCAKWLRSIA